MEQKDKNPGILGVVADLIKVESSYETGDRNGTWQAYPEYCDGTGKRPQNA